MFVLGKYVAAILLLISAPLVAQIVTSKVKVRAALVDKDLNQKPAPHLMVIFTADSDGPAASREIKTDLDGNAEFLAPPGKYKFVTKLTDDLSKQTASAETLFEVTGPTVESSAELTVRNFGFYRSEDDTKPIPVAAYRAGDTLFARFNMVGFRFGERNTIDLAYDVAVLNPEGKEIYAQPNAAVEKSFSFYPKPYVPGGMNLNLQPDMRKGQYTIVLTVHDFAGKQNYETRQTFSVE